MKLPTIPVFLGDEEQYRCFSRSGVDPKKVVAVIEGHFMLSVYPRPSVLSTEKLIPARLTGLVLSAGLRSSNRKQSKSSDHNLYDSGSCETAQLVHFKSVKPQASNSRV